jgi:hypothetical protein
MAEPEGADPLTKPISGCDYGAKTATRHARMVSLALPLASDNGQLALPSVYGWRSGHGCLEMGISHRSSLHSVGGHGGAVVTHPARPHSLLSGYERAIKRGGEIPHPGFARA